MLCVTAMEIALHAPTDVQLTLSALLRSASLRNVSSWLCYIQHSK